MKQPTDCAHDRGYFQLDTKSKNGNEIECKLGYNPIVNTEREKGGLSERKAGGSVYCSEESSGECEVKPTEK